MARHCIVFGLLSCVLLLATPAYAQTAFDLTVQYVEQPVKATTVEKAMANILEGKETPADAKVEMIAFRCVPVGKQELKQSLTTLEEGVFEVSCKVQVSDLQQGKDRGRLLLELRLEAGRRRSLLPQSQGHLSVLVGWQLETSAVVAFGSRTVVHASVSKAEGKTVVRSVVVALQESKAPAARDVEKKEQ